MDEQPDLFGGRFARDEGMDSVSRHNEEWMAAAVAEARRYIESTRHFTGEDIRFHCTKMIGPPLHSNAWGALTNKLVRSGWIRKTGMTQQMRLTSSHARVNPIYEAVPS
jgi:hypothetical protein